MKIMQGDSYPIPVDIMQDGVVVTPEMVEDMEITVGAEIRKLYSAGDITFENNTWYFLLKQQDTFSMSGNNEVVCRLKYPVTGIHAESIADCCIIVTKPDPVTDPQPFRIYRINPVSKGTITNPREN